MALILSVSEAYVKQKLLYVARYDNQIRDLYVQREPETKGGEAKEPKKYSDRRDLTGQLMGDPQPERSMVKRLRELV